LLPRCRRQLAADGKAIEEVLLQLSRLVKELSEFNKLALDPIVALPE
jgi:hypothetical protein